jgi:hypothetical protein
VRLSRLVPLAGERRTARSRERPFRGRRDQPPRLVTVKGAQFSSSITIRSGSPGWSDQIAAIWLGAPVAGPPDTELRRRSMAGSPGCVGSTPKATRSKANGLTS